MQTALRTGTTPRAHCPFAPAVFSSTSCLLPQGTLPSRSRARGSLRVSQQCFTLCRGAVRASAKKQKGKALLSNLKEETGELFPAVSPGAGKVAHVAGLPLSCSYTVHCCSWASPCPKVTWQHCRGTGTEASPWPCHCIRRASSSMNEPSRLGARASSSMLTAPFVCSWKEENCRGSAHYFC